MGITIGIPVGVTMIMAMLVEDWLPEAFWEFVLMAPKVPWGKNERSFNGEPISLPTITWYKGTGE